MNIDDYAIAEGLTKDGGTYDTAIPQAWWDDFFQVMGCGPVGIVWYYSKRSIWGKPVGITDEGKADLAEYERITAV